MWPLWVKCYGHKGKNHSSEVQKTDIHQIKERGNVGPLCVYFSFELLSGFIIDFFSHSEERQFSWRTFFSLGVENWNPFHLMWVVHHHVYHNNFLYSYLFLLGFWALTTFSLDCKWWRVLHWSERKHREDFKRSFVFVTQINDELPCFLYRHCFSSLEAWYDYLLMLGTRTRQAKQRTVIITWSESGVQLLCFFKGSRWSFCTTNVENHSLIK